MFYMIKLSKYNTTICRKKGRRIARHYEILQITVQQHSETFKH